MTDAHDRPDCDRDLLTAYALGELGPAARDKVAAHLVECNDCWQQLRISRAVTTAVQQLWEPAPASVRADLRAAILAAPTPRREHTGRRRRVVIGLVAAAGIAAATISAVELTGTGHIPRTSVAQQALPAAVQVALARYAQPHTGDTARALAPRLDRVGLRLDAATRTQVVGVDALCFTYVGASANRIDLLLSRQAWPRPAQAHSLARAGWITTTADGMTVLAGPDAATDQMLIIAADHATAMTAAAALGLI
jgi:anti-sigma factor RsiW